MQLRTDPLHAAFDLTLALVDDEDQRDLLARVLAAGRPAVDKAAYDVVREVVEGINEDLGDDARIELTYTPDGTTALGIASVAPAAACAVEWARNETAGTALVRRQSSWRIAWNTDGRSSTNSPPGRSPL
jgi:hypothetical protein